MPRRRESDKEIALRWFTGLSKSEQQRAIEDLQLAQRAIELSRRRQAQQEGDMLPEWDQKVGGSGGALEDWAQRLGPASAEEA